MAAPRKHAHPLIVRLWKFGRAELGALIALLIAAAGLLAFAAITDEMMEGEALDQRVLDFLRPGANPHDALGPKWFEHMVAELTTLGGTTLLTLFAAIVVGFLLIKRRVASALLVVVALDGGMMISEGVKALFGRDRPPMAYRAVETMSASFPSGHAMLSTITYLTLGALLAQVMPTRREKIYVFTVAVLLALVVGASRIYLGVHWTTDVLAGWSLGAAWAMICWLALWAIRRFLRRHDTPITEPPVEGE